MTGDMRRDWLEQALARGESHVQVPVEDYEEALEVLEVLDESQGVRIVTKKFGVHLFFWEAGAICALALGFGWLVLRVICVCRGG